mmetsp:Transcript_766/g.1858  ORF Transcript_766/g.1858 Transcript_766/m.1858 type:complete len:227 (-) Transcript_766:682-1362(-)
MRSRMQNQSRVEGEGPNRPDDGGGQGLNPVALIHSPPGVVVLNAPVDEGKEASSFSREGIEEAVPMQRCHLYSLHPAIAGGHGEEAGIQGDEHRAGRVPYQDAVSDISRLGAPAGIVMSMRRLAPHGDVPGAALYSKGAAQGQLPGQEHVDRDADPRKGQRHTALLHDPVHLKRLPQGQVEAPEAELLQRSLQPKILQGSQDHQGAVEHREHQAMAPMWLRRHEAR